MSADPQNTAPDGKHADDDPLATFGSEGRTPAHASSVVSAASAARGVSPPPPQPATLEPLGDTGLDAFASQGEPIAAAPAPAPVAQPPTRVQVRPRTPSAPGVATPPARVVPTWVGLAAALVVGVSVGLLYARYMNSPPIGHASPPPGVVTSATPGPRAEAAPQSPPLLLPTERSTPDVIVPLPKPTEPVSRTNLQPRNGVSSRGGINAHAGVALASIAMPVVDGALPVSAEASVVPSPAIDLVEDRAEMPDDRRRIRAVLDDYRQAYERLDAVSTAALWPGVDTRGLTRAFGSLSRQRISFDRCDIRITGAQATAQCDGAIEYVRRVGDAAPQSRDISWSFALDQRASEWRIVNVSAR